MKATCERLAKYFNLSLRTMRLYLDRFNVEKIREGRRIYYEINLAKIEQIRNFLNEHGRNYEEILRLRKINRDLKRDNINLEKLRKFLIKNRNTSIRTEEIILIVGLNPS